MDAIKYKAITGLDNYEGVKSLLKSSSNFGSFNITDDTIVLVDVYSFSSDYLLTDPFPFRFNGFGVIINCTEHIFNAATHNIFTARNVNAQDIEFFGQASNGLVVTNNLGALMPTTGSLNVTFAYFTLH